MSLKKTKLTAIALIASGVLLAQAPVVNAQGKEDAIWVNPYFWICLIAIMFFLVWRWIASTGAGREDLANPEDAGPPMIAGGISEGADEQHVVFGQAACVAIIAYYKGGYNGILLPEEFRLAGEIERGQLYGHVLVQYSDGLYRRRKLEGQLGYRVPLVLDKDGKRGHIVTNVYLLKSSGNGVIVSGKELPEGDFTFKTLGRVEPPPVSAEPASHKEDSCEKEDPDEEADHWPAPESVPDDERPVYTVSRYGDSVIILGDGSENARTILLPTIGDIEISTEQAAVFIHTDISLTQVFVPTGHRIVLREYPGVSKKKRSGTAAAHPAQSTREDDLFADGFRNYNPK